MLREFPPEAPSQEEHELGRGGGALHILCSCLSKGCLASLPPLVGVGGGVNMGATGETVTFRFLDST